jgi:hypothetical protein
MNNVHSTIIFVVSNFGLQLKPKYAAQYSIKALHRGSCY